MYESNRWVKFKFTPVTLIFSPDFFKAADLLLEYLNNVSDCSVQD